MKTNPCFPLALLTALFLCSLISFAQRPIKGNGNIVTRTYAVSDYNKLVVDESGLTVEVRCGTKSMVEITTDENLQKYLQGRVSNRTLTLEQTIGWPNDWIAPTKVLVRIQTPVLESLETVGSANVKVFNLSTRTFNLNSSVGQVTLQGRSDVLTIRGDQVFVDASALQVKKLDVQMAAYGRVNYSGQPRIVPGSTGELIALSEQKSDPALKYVQVELYNNRSEESHLRIIGPSLKQFSFGFALQPFGKRTEKLPVGTKLKTGNGQYVYTLRSADDNKTLALFK